MTEVFWFLHPAYWEYLFAKPFNIAKLFCRIRKHPHGIVWFNAGGLEPDYHCLGCDDDLG